MWNSGLPLPGSDRGDSVAILCLHGVHTQDMTRVCPPPTSSISVESFQANAEQLARLYRVISLGDAIAMLAGKTPWIPKCAVLTFDDSLLCTTAVAFPILHRLGLPATVFLSTEAIDRRRPYWWLRVDYAVAKTRLDSAKIILEGVSFNWARGDREAQTRIKRALRKMQAPLRDAAVAEFEARLDVRLEDPELQFPFAAPMSWDDARRAARDGFELGSHTVTHPNLAILTPGEADAELAGARARIEERCAVSCRFFCYPYGAYTAEVAAAVARCGYEGATTTTGPGRNRRGQDRFALRRYTFPGARLKLGYVLSGLPALLNGKRS